MFTIGLQGVTCAKEDRGNCYRYMWRGASLICRSY